MLNARKVFALVPVFVSLAVSVQGCSGAQSDESDSTSADEVSGAVGNWSGFTAGQCVHGVYSFYLHRYGISLEGTGAQSGNIGNCEFEGACMIWKSSRVEPTEVASTKSKFVKYAWGTTMPQTYDIVVYPPRTTGLGPGHVAAVDHMASSNPAAWQHLYVMDSNYYGGERLATAVHTVSRAPYGIFRLKSLDHDTTPPKPADVAPKGYLDAASCSGVAGWAQDTNAPTISIFTDVYFDGPAGSAAATGLRVTANANRSDLCTALGSCDHGWSVGIPRSQLTGTAHPVYAYGIDSAGGANTLLTDSGKTFSCEAPAIPEATTVKRLIKTPAIATSWKFSMFYDAAPYSAAALAALKDGDNFDAQPDVVQVKGEPDIYVVDGNQRRHVANMGSFAAWRFTTSMIEPITATALAALEDGLDWPEVPLLVSTPSGQTDDVYVLDNAESVPASGNASAPPGATGSSKDLRVANAAAASNPNDDANDPNVEGDDPGAPEDGGNAGASSGCSITHRSSSTRDAIWALLPLAGLFLARRRKTSAKA
jgi:hypothetical protein